MKWLGKVVWETASWHTACSGVRVGRMRPGGPSAWGPQRQDLYHQPGAGTTCFSILLSSLTPTSEPQGPGGSSPVPPVCVYTNAEDSIELQLRLPTTMRSINISLHQEIILAEKSERMRISWKTQQFYTKESRLNVWKWRYV